MRDRGQVRAFCWGFGACAAVVAMLGAAGAWEQPRGRVANFDTVVLKELRLVDAQGNLAAELKVGAEGGELRMYAPGGGVTGSLGACGGGGSGGGGGGGAASPGTGAPAGTPAVQAPDRPKAQWEDPARWTELKRGQSSSAVKRILGEPERVVKGSGGESWWYGHGNVFITKGNQLSSWVEPRWDR